MKTKGLGGLTFESGDPDRLAAFYKEKFGLPLELRIHGGLYEHWECDFNGIHFAILKAKELFDGNLIVPSFIVDNIHAFVEINGLSFEDEVLDLGEGQEVASIRDIDGNMIRLWSKSA